MIELLEHLETLKAACSGMTVSVTVEAVHHVHKSGVESAQPDFYWCLHIHAPQGCRGFYGNWLPSVMDEALAWAKRHSAQKEAA